eukprot:Blabericola_migrator_1__13321@NODE_937_length_5973_cov_17_376736_g651_i0_p2_GENE_NODE_937_length_5973_cov_17_376736_g651_i0NODE_937_length_5973_cov_17_376736_g651_i0_p2_ORF_typecomplete_len259_score45_54_NODE_937_length_5973_cov_17_376736_g651_i017452521
MTFSRSVVIQKSSARGLESELHALLVVFTSIGPLNTNSDVSDPHHDMSCEPVNASVDPQLGTDSNEASKGCSNLLDFFTQHFGTEDVLPCFETALAEAAEEIKVLPEEAAVPERLDILVKHFKIKLAEAGLTPKLERALETTLPKESRLATLSGWARSGLNQVFRCGREVVSRTLYVPFATLLGMAPPVGDESDGMVDEALYNAVVVDPNDDFATAVRDWWSAPGVTTVGTPFVYDALLMSFIVHALKSVSPQERRCL